MVGLALFARQRSGERKNWSSIALYASKRVNLLSENLTLDFCLHNPNPNRNKRADIARIFRVATHFHWSEVGVRCRCCCCCWRRRWWWWWSSFAKRTHALPLHNGTHFLLFRRVFFISQPICYNHAHHECIASYQICVSTYVHTYIHTYKCNHWAAMCLYVTSPSTKCQSTMQFQMKPNEKMKGRCCFSLEKNGINWRSTAQTHTK